MCETCTKLEQLIESRRAANLVALRTTATEADALREALDTKLTAERKTAHAILVGLAPMREHSAHLAVLAESARDLVLDVDDTYKFDTQVIA